MNDLFNSQILNLSLPNLWEEDISVFPLKGIQYCTFQYVYDKIETRLPKRYQKMQFEFEYQLQEQSLQEIYEIALLKNIFKQKTVAASESINLTPILSSTLTISNLYKQNEFVEVTKNKSHQKFESQDENEEPCEFNKVFSFPEANDIQFFTTEDAYLLYLLGINEPDFLIGVCVVDRNHLEEDFMGNEVAFNILYENRPIIVGAVDVSENSLFYCVEQNGEEIDEQYLDSNFVERCQAKGGYFSFEAIIKEINQKLFEFFDKKTKEIYDNEQILRVVEGKQIFGDVEFDRELLLLPQDYCKLINRFSREDGIWKPDIFGEYKLSTSELELIVEAEKSAINIEEYDEFKSNQLQHRKLLRYSLMMLKTGQYRIAEKLLCYSHKICQLEDERIIINFLILISQNKQRMIDKQLLSLSLFSLKYSILALIKKGYVNLCMQYLIFLIRVVQKCKDNDETLITLQKQFVIVSSFAYQGINQVYLKGQYCKYMHQSRFSQYLFYQNLNYYLNAFSFYDQQKNALVSFLRKNQMNGIQFSKLLLSNLTGVQIDVFKKLNCFSYFYQANSLHLGLYLPLISKYSTKYRDPIKFTNNQLFSFNLMQGMRLYCDISQEHIQNFGQIRCSSNFTFFKREVSEMYISDVEESNLVCLLSGQETKISISFPSLLFSARELPRLEIIKVQLEYGNFQITSVEYDLLRFRVYIYGVYYSSSLNDRILDIELNYRNSLVKCNFEACEFYSRYKYAILMVKEIKMMNLNYFCNLYSVTDIPNTYSQTHIFIVVEVKIIRQQVSFVSLQNIELGYFKNGEGQLEEIKYNSNLLDSCLLLFSKSGIEHNELNFIYGFDKLGKVDVCINSITQQIQQISMGHLYKLYEGEMVIYAGNSIICNAGKRIVINRNHHILEHAIFRPHGEFLDSTSDKQLENNIWLDDLSQEELLCEMDAEEVIIRIPQFIQELNPQISSETVNCSVFDENEEYIVFRVESSPFAFTLYIQCDDIEFEKVINYEFE